MDDRKHGGEHTSTEMMRSHYRMFALNVVLGGVIMYLAMFTMIRDLSGFFNNLNMLYMALVMLAPMTILMLLTMRSMFQNAKLNAILYVAFVLAFIVAFAGLRSQALVGDRQFLRSMIPHHSGALLMCQESALSDAEIRDLCFGSNGIVESQKREIAQMEAILARQ